jgi:hypothetical protein
MHDPLKPFSGCSDAASLRCAIQELCTEKGIISRVDIWTLVKAGKRQALCFLRTDPAVHEQKLAGTPGLTRIGNEMLFIVDLPPEAAAVARSL